RTAVGVQPTFPVSPLGRWAVKHPRRHISADRGAPPPPPHLIGGADVAAELDAKRAVKQGTELAATL
ncbi:hypothetical protein ACFWCO_08715, partial [Streptomyces diastaticus]|uniref:hypothetical protein n=1 Tax=Streptomyces diastaticus TaxID=1956 RepID=UPI0036ADB4A5